MMLNSTITVKGLLSLMRENAGLPVIFFQDDQQISQGYHITEVKRAHIESLDCGQGTDQWRELVIELLDGNQNSSAGFMSAGKMLGILDKALDRNGEDEQAQLYFEFATNNNKLQKSVVETMGVNAGSIVITLAGTQAQCKPYQRALENGTASADGSGCCAPNTKESSGSACCGDSSEDTAKSTCC